MLSPNDCVVSVCGKDEFREDDIKKDGYLVIIDSVIKDVVNSKDDHNENRSIINIVVVNEEDDVLVKWMVITYKEEMKKMIMRTTHAKEGKDPPRWWDVQLNKGGCTANIPSPISKKRTGYVEEAPDFYIWFDKTHRLLD